MVKTKPIAALSAFPWASQGMVVDHPRARGRDVGSFGCSLFVDFSGCVGYVPVIDGAKSADEPVCGWGCYSACARCTA